MKNVHSWRHLKCHGRSDADGMNNSQGYDGVYVSENSQLPILWRFSACPTPSVYNRKMNTFATEGYFL
jgi:hypothetical protein